jgi:hypothetical protein
MAILILFTIGFFTQRFDLLIHSIGGDVFSMVFGGNRASLDFYVTVKAIQMNMPTFLIAFFAFPCLDIGAVLGFAEFAVMYYLEH